jgi:8-oxo-dGTP diphosphatase
MSPLPAAAHRVAVDVVALAIADDEAQTPVFLTVCRPRDPFAGVAALPGTLVRTDEDLEAAATRVLHELAGLDDPRHLEQLATFGAPTRDPRGRVVSVSYLALFPRPRSPAQRATWYPVTASPPLAFDHAEILASAVERLQGKLSYSNVAYGLLPDTFTLSELQTVYESVLAREVDKRNFRKKVLAVGMVTEAPGQRRGSHRPAQLYRFTRERLVVLDDVISA